MTDNWWNDAEVILRKHEMMLHLGNSLYLSKKIKRAIYYWNLARKLIARWYKLELRRMIEEETEQLIGEPSTLWWRIR